MKAETLKSIHPIYPSPTIGKMPMSEAYRSIIIINVSNDTINISNGSRDIYYRVGLDDRGKPKAPRVLLTWE